MTDRGDEDHEIAGAWSERSGRFLRRYLPYVVGLTAATGILWYGAVPQFRAAGWGNAVSAPDDVGTTVRAQAVAAAEPTVTVLVEPSLRA
ncbi:MAG: hypothetical protein WAL50_11805, partial [Kineosporiaceae bacterium]